jgi:cbb3-type cytochrome oxidase subunit 3
MFFGGLILPQYTLGSICLKTIRRRAFSWHTIEFCLILLPSIKIIIKKENKEGNMFNKRSYVLRRLVLLFSIFSLSFLLWPFIAYRDHARQGKPNAALCVSICSRILWIAGPAEQSAHQLPMERMSAVKGYVVLAAQQVGRIATTTGQMVAKLMLIQIPGIVGDAGMSALRGRHAAVGRV